MTMTRSAVFIILSTVSLSAGQPASPQATTGPSSPAAAVSTSSYVPPAAAAVPVRAAAAAAAVPVRAAPAQAAYEAAAPVVKEEPKKVHMVSGSRATYTILKEGMHQEGHVGVGDTVFADVRAFLPNSNKPFYDTKIKLGGKVHVWIAGETFDEQPVASAKEMKQLKGGQMSGGGMIKGLDRAVIGMAHREIRELRLPSDEAFGSAGTKKWPAASEYRVELEVTKMKHKGQGTQKARKLKAEQDKKDAELAEKNRRLQEEAAARKPAPAVGYAATAAKVASSAMGMGKTAPAAAAKEESDMKRNEDM